MCIEVLGLGVVAMDIVLNCQQLPDEDGYVVIDDEFAMPGGSCANVLASLAGLGTTPGLVARLGDDRHGQALWADLDANGVSTRYVSVKKDGVSMHTYIAVAQGGAKTIFCHMGDSVLSLTEKEVRAEMLNGVKIFYTAMQPCKPALKLARLCREKEIPVVCNLQVEPDFLDRCGVSRSMIDEMMSLCGLLVTFKHGLIRYSGQSDIDAAVRSVYDRHRPEMGLMVTLGKDGVLWFDGNGTLTVPAFQVKAVDTTGAGDAFLGGFIHARFFERAAPKAAMEFANACAALKCTQPGPRLKALKSDILKFMAQHETI